MKVTVDNYVCAQSNVNMAGYVKRGAFRQWLHQRSMVDVDNQIVIRSNVDTPYPYVIADLTTPVTRQALDNAYTPQH